MLAKRAELAEVEVHVVAMGAAGLVAAVRGDDKKCGVKAAHDWQCQRTEAQPQRVVVRRRVVISLLAKVRGIRRTRY